MKKDKMGTGIVKKPVQTREDNTEGNILKEAIHRAQIGYDAHKDNMDRAEDDVNFIFGYQYTEEELSEKEMENRVSMTFNKLPQYINRVVGQQRSSVQTINITPTGSSIGRAEQMLTTTKGRNMKLSEVLTDLVRDIEFQSNAVADYKMAFKHAVEGGFGWLRVLTKYQDDGFDLDIQIKGIRDRWSVIIDPDAVESDRSDMNWAFISERITVEEFNKRYPNKSYESLPGTDPETATYWGDDKTVTISEYFRREPITKEISLLSNNEVIDSDDLKDEEVQERMKENGITVIKTRMVQTHKVIWCKISQGSILEPEIEFPTTTIPVIPVLGRETDLRGKRYTKGLINDAKDEQRALNEMKSAALERVDASPITPWIATDKSIEGYEEQWKYANTTKFATLVYKKGEEKPTRDIGATMPVAEINMSREMIDDMKSSIGIYDAAIGNRSNEISGKAIRARQSEADTGTYEFIDNYQNAIRRVGLLVVELIPKVYDTERIIQLRGADGSIDTMQINTLSTDKNTGQDIVLNPLDAGKHTVVVSSGASYETKQDENAEQIMELMRVNPKVAEVGTDLLVKNLDFSDSDVLAERLIKTIPPQLLSKEKQEKLKEEMPEPQPTPEQQMAAQEAQMKQAEMQNKLEVEKIKLEIEKIKLETARIMAGQKIADSRAKSDDREEARKDETAKAIAEQIRQKSAEKKATPEA